MKRLSICWIIGCLLELVACRPEVPTQAEQGETDVFPDYREVTVPVNMAPPNFKLVDQQLQGIIRLKTMNGELIIAADHGVFNLPETDWKVLSQDAQGKQIDVTVYFREPQSDWKQMSFPIYVSRDSVDAYLVYRRIFPGYRMWNEMGIYQRCVENYVEKSILDNQSTNNSCMNCHAFCERQGEQMLFHQRGSHNGTYLIDHRQVKKIALERDGKPASFVYPYWHPSGRYVAFSTNETHQDFHLSDENRIEVYDVESDVLIYDTEKERVFSSPLLASMACYETFPTFTPDGNYLLFCSADSVCIPENYRDVRYNLLRVAFDPKDGSIGTQVDTLYNAREAGRSVKFPRVSPDGKRLLYTVSDYGNFSIWHKDADLHMLDLSTGAIDSLPEVNSPDVESYHSWSGNSRWFVFSSRRGDGLFTRPYLVHVDERGQCGKPFLLPQASPDYYERSLFSFNVPEFIRTPVLISKERLVEASGKEEVTTIKRIEGI